MERFRDPGNPLFVLARSGRRLTSWWAIPLLLLLFTVAGAAGILFPLETAGEAGLWRSALETSAFLVTGYAPIAVLVVIWVWKREGRGPGTLGLRHTGAIRNLLYGFGFGFGMVAVGVALLLTSGDTTLEFDQSDTMGWIAVAPGLVVLAGWSVQGFTEELMFRGWMLQNTCVQLGPITGAIVTTFFFALAHVDNPGLTPLGTLNLALIGVLFVMLAFQEGGIWAVTGFHIAWNWAQSNVFGFKVSGLDIGGGSFVQVIPGGSETFTGGDFGFEGSIAATTTIVISILVVIALGSRD